MTSNKKRKRTNNGTATTTGPTSMVNNDLETSKPSAVFTPKSGGRPWTLSVALPGSIIANAQSYDQKMYLAGQIARALAVFSVDEVVIFDDGREGHEASLPIKDPNASTAYSHPSHFLAHVLSYLETPSHLRKYLFDMHPNLRTAGTLPSLDIPHHSKGMESRPYREGVVVSSDDKGSYVDTGLSSQSFIEDVQIPINSRVTVKLGGKSDPVEPVNPSEPREVAGYYWGYTIRQCDSLSAVLTECPFDGGYDLSIGTSERGRPLTEVITTEIPSFQHLLLVFGGVAGLEVAAANDAELVEKGITKTNVGELFDIWVNILPGQGSRTIRTEEAVWLGLMGTRPFVENR